MNKLRIFFDKHETAIVLISLFIMLAIRLVYITRYGNYDTASFQDALEYNNYAKNLLSSTGGIFSSDFFGSIREPFYAFVVAGIYGLFGVDNYTAVYIFHALLSTLMLYLIYKMSILILRNKAAALMAVLWAGVYIFYLRWVGEILRETVVYTLLILLFYILAWMFIRKKTNFLSILWAALVYTSLFHTDGRYLFYAPFLIIPFLLFQKPWIKALKNYVIFGIMVLLLTIPWTIRNYIVYKQWIVISPYTLNLSSTEVSARGELFVFAPIDSAYSTKHYIPYNANYPTESERDSILRGFNPQNRSVLELTAIAKGKRASRTYLGRRAYFFRNMWSPVRITNGYAPFPMAYFEVGHSSQHNLISLVQYGLLLPFALFAICLSLYKRNKHIVFLLLPVFIQMFLHLVTFGIERYRHPVDSFIIILGCWGMLSLVVAFRRSCSVKNEQRTMNN